MLIGLMAAALACVGYGTASVLQAYGARSSEVVAAGHGQRTEVTATGAPTLRSTISRRPDTDVHRGDGARYRGFPGKHRLGPSDSVVPLADDHQREPCRDRAC